AGYALSGALKLIPDFLAGAAGFGGSPTITPTMGGQQIGNSAEMARPGLSSIGRILGKSARMVSTHASSLCRSEEWDFQVRLADRELAQIDAQIAASKIHVDMLDKDLKAHDLQVANAQSLDQVMRAKFTNQQLYDWMIGQISTVYFQGYKL